MSIDIGYVDIVSASDRTRIEAPLFDLFFEELYRYPSAFDLGLVVYLANDSARHLAHIPFFAVNLLGRPPRLSFVLVIVRPKSSKICSRGSTNAPTYTENLNCCVRNPYIVANEH